MKFGNSSEEGFWKAKQRKQKQGTHLLLSSWKSRPAFGQLKKLRKACCSQMANRGLQHSFPMISSKRLKATPASALSLPLSATVTGSSKGVQHQGTTNPAQKANPDDAGITNLLWVPLLLPWWGQQTDKWEGQNAWGTNIWGRQEAGPLHLLLFQQQWLKPVSKPTGKWH